MNNRDKRLLILFANSGFAPSDIAEIRASLHRFIADRAIVGVRFSNIRVSSRHVQVDFFVEPQICSITQFLETLKGWCEVVETVDLSVERYAKMDAEAVLMEAVRLFNQERYWEFHEALEVLWRAERAGPKKEILQGIILAAAGLVHMQKNRESIGLGVMYRALRKLESVPAEHRILPPIDVGNLLDQIRSAVYSSRLRRMSLSTSIGVS